MSAATPAAANISLDIKRYRIKHIRPPSNVVIIGGRESGKTTIVKSLLHHTQIRGKGIIVSSTPEEYEGQQDNSKYWSIMDDEDFLDENPNLEKYDVRVFDEAPNSDISEIFFDRRSFNIITVQHPLDISNDIIRQIDYVILLDGLTRDLRKIWFKLAGIVPKYRQFKKIYERCTGKFDFLLIDFTGHSRRILDHIFWGCADETSSKKKYTKNRVELTDITSSVSKEFVFSKVHEGEVVQVPTAAAAKQSTTTTTTTYTQPPPPPPPSPSPSPRESDRYPNPPPATPPPTPTPTPLPVPKIVPKVISQSVTKDTENISIQIEKPTTTPPPPPPQVPEVRSVVVKADLPTETTTTTATTTFRPTDANHNDDNGRSGGSGDGGGSGERASVSETNRSDDEDDDDDDRECIIL